MKKSKETKAQITEKEYKYALPIADIKKDLIRTAVFAVFAVATIFTISLLLPQLESKFDFGSYKLF